MARLAMCGWESGSISEVPYIAIVGTGSLTGNNVRTGNYAVSTYLSTGFYDTAERGPQWTFTLTNNPVEIYFRLGVRLLLSGDSNNIVTTFMSFDYGVTRHITLRIAKSGAIAAYLGGSTGVLRDAGGTLSSSWSCVEGRVLIDNTIGRVQLWVNGVLVINFTGDTQNGGTAGINLVRLGIIQELNAGDCGSSAFVFDDIAINDTTGSRNNGRIGQGGIYPLFPTADTADKDWARSAGSDNYALVNSYPPDDDTTYVTATSVGDRDLYEFGNLTNVNSIDAIAISGRLKTTFGAGAPVGFAMRSGATTGDVASHNVNAQWTTFTDVIETDPNTAAAWTLEAVNSVQAGFTIL